MPTIFDPNNLWLGPAPMAQLSNSNKLPVAIDDALSVLRDSGPVTVDVLANDFDPEGQPLTLISATAALGTAVAETDDTVTYTPPSGLTGFDTVVYTIADDLGQTRSGQINVTITEPQLSVDVQSDNTLVVNAATGALDIMVTTPAEFAGTYQVDVADLISGPVNLVPPTVSGTFAAGQTLTATGGLWIFDAAAGQPLTSWQWLRAGTTEIPGATSASYTVQASDIGLGVSARETETDGSGQRSAESSVLGTGFTPASDGALIGWWDANDTATITESSGAVTSWTDKAGGNPLTQAGINARPETDSRTLNGLNVIDFDGTDFLEAARSLPASGDVAFHMAVVIDAIDNEYDAVFSVEATNDFQLDAGNAATFVGRLNPIGIGSPTTLSGGPFSGGLILSVVFDRTGAASAEVFVANTLRGTMAYGTPIDAAAALHVMTNRSQNAWIDGAVAEIVVTGDTSNRADHHNYLAAKWGLI